MGQTSEEFLLDNWVYMGVHSQNRAKLTLNFTFFLKRTELEVRMICMEL